MTQGALPFEYEAEPISRKLTCWAGFPVYLDLVLVAGLADSIDHHLGARSNGIGWTDSQQVLALVFLQLLGGDCVDDIERLEADEGLGILLRRLEDRHLPRHRRRARLRRWRRERTRAVPSATALRRYLRLFHNDEATDHSLPGCASVPAPPPLLRGLQAVQRDLLAFAQRQAPESVATLDQDATLVKTTKREAHFGYKGFRCYQPTNVWWAEKEMVVHSEFRDGNVPAGMGNLRVLREALQVLPSGVRTVRLRSDSAAYDWELLRYCEEGKDERFGRIEFAVSCDINEDFRNAVRRVPDEEWRPLYDYDVPQGHPPVPTPREWAEVLYVPQGSARRKLGNYRFLVTRELRDQDPLPGLTQPALPFPALQSGGRTYKLHGVVTNILDWDGEDVFHFLDDRMGKSEQAHAVMKYDLAGGKLPSGYFGVNAAWWQIMILALNLHALLRKALDPSFQNRRLKAIRFHLLQLPGRISERSRRLRILLSSAAETSLRHLLRVRQRISAWARPPPALQAAQV
jgi:hypothetical protein